MFPFPFKSLSWEREEDPHLNLIETTLARILRKLCAFTTPAPIRSSFPCEVGVKAD